MLFTCDLFQTANQHGARPGLALSGGLDDGGLGRIADHAGEMVGAAREKQRSQVEGDFARTAEEQDARHGWVSWMVGGVEWRGGWEQMKSLNNYPRLGTLMRGSSGISNNSNQMYC